MKLRGNERGLLNENLLGDQYLLKEIPQNSVKYFLDVGANVGIISILARLLHPAMHCVAVEPCGDTFRELEENVSNLRIKALNIAYGNGEDFRIYKRRKTSMNNQYLPPEMCVGRVPDRETEPEIVRSCQLAKIVELGGIDVENCAMKFDCEGAEHLLRIDIAGKDLMRKARYVSIEVHPFGKYSAGTFTEWCTIMYRETHKIEINFYNNNEYARIKMRKI